MEDTQGFGEGMRPDGEVRSSLGLGLWVSPVSPQVLDSEGMCGVSAALGFLVSLRELQALALMLSCWVHRGPNLLAMHAHHCDGQSTGQGGIVHYYSSQPQELHPEELSARAF